MRVYIIIYLYDIIAIKDIFFYDGLYVLWYGG